jgi:topoisomerase IV subunit A
LLEPLPYEATEEVVPEELEAQGETEVDPASDENNDIQPDEDG